MSLSGQTFKSFLRKSVLYARRHSVVIVGIAAGLASVAFTWTCVLGGICGNEVHREIQSPDAKYKIVIFERDCGATTDFSTQVSILRASKKLSSDDAGNAFVAAHRVALDARWKDARTVEITYSPATERVTKQAQVEEVRVLYP